MTYAGDRLYNDVIRRMMARLASDIKMKDIITRLPCLTLTDREEIEAKKDNSGNYSAMTHLLDCLRRRENWPEEFIAALWECEHRALATEISNAYDRIRGINRPAPADANAPAPPASVPSVTPSPGTASVTTVTKATIHNAPCCTPPMLTPSLVEVPAQLSVPDIIHSPIVSLINISPPGPAETPAPKAPAQPAESVPNHVRPPSPVSVDSVTHSLELNPFNNGATSTADSSDDFTLTVVPDPSSSAATHLPSNIVTTSLSHSNTPHTSSQPSDAPEESKIPIGVSESESMKHPIQDSNPPKKVTVNSDVSQHVETGRTMVSPNSQTQAASSVTTQESVSAPNNAVAGQLSHRAAEGEEYFSKPGILVEAEPSMYVSDDLQISRPPTERIVNSPQQPEEACSTSSDDLMFSASTVTGGPSGTQPAQCTPPTYTEVPSQPVPVTPPAASENLVPHSTPEEYSFPETEISLSSNQPVEDHYESCPSSKEGPETLENVGKISEETTMLNLNGEPPSMIGNTVHINGNNRSQTESPLSSALSEIQPGLSSTQHKQRSKVHAGQLANSSVDLSVSVEPGTSKCRESGVNTGQIPSHLPEQRENAKESHGEQLQNQAGPHLILAAGAAISLAAIFMAWKFKH